MKPVSVYHHFLCLIMGLLCLSQAQAIIIRHDLEDSRYIVYPEQYPQLFYLHTRFGNKICVATLISPQWAITAGHCIEETPLGEQFAAREPYPVLIDGNTHDITQVVMHPAYAHPQQLEAVDLALIKLDQAVNIQPAALYQEQDELNQVVSFLGWGFSGMGTPGRAFNDGNLRRAQNTVMNAGKWLEFIFDDPRENNSAALELEGIPGLGDSGGPALIESQDGLVIMGVALGELYNPQQAQSGNYGAISLYERISSHIDWVFWVIENR